MNISGGPSKPMQQPAQSSECSRHNEHLLTGWIIDYIQSPGQCFECSLELGKWSSEPSLDTSSLQKLQTTFIADSSLADRWLVKLLSSLTPVAGFVHGSGHRDGPTILNSSWIANKSEFSSKFQMLEKSVFHRAIKPPSSLCFIFVAPRARQKKVWLFSCMRLVQRSAGNSQIFKSTLDRKHSFATTTHRFQRHE